MRRPWSVRLMRACLALWFVLSGGEPGLSHGCPMHDGVPPTAAAAHASAGPDAMAGAPAAHHHGPAHDHGSSHACTCVGACSAPSAVASIHVTPVLQAALARRDVPAPVGDTGVVVAEHAPHALPFANGPPAALRTA